MVAISHIQKRWVFIGLIFFVLIVAGTGIINTLRPGRTEAPTTNVPNQHEVLTGRPNIRVSTVLSGKQFIWDVDFLPEGQLIFTERSGSVSFLEKGVMHEIGRIPDVRVAGEGGLMGLAIDPLFTQNRVIYTCYNASSDIRVVRWTIANDFKKLEQRKDIVIGMPTNTTGQAGRHSGCQLAFGPDGYLWIGTGDTAQGDIAVQPKSLGGKILRVDREGLSAPDNLGGIFDPRIYSYGHRNTQGIAFFTSPKQGVVGVSDEHGPGKDDEVNELRKGNFGWAPPAKGYDENVPMTDTKRFPDAISSIWSSGEPTQAPSGLAVLKGAKWRDWNGALAMPMLRGSHLRILQLDEQNKVTKEEEMLVHEYGRLRAATQGPDGSLYISTSNGSDDKILKLTPQ